MPKRDIFSSFGLTGESRRYTFRERTRRNHISRKMLHIYFFFIAGACYRGKQELKVEQMVAKCAGANGGSAVLPDIYTGWRAPRTAGEDPVHRSHEENGESQRRGQRRREGRMVSIIVFLLPSLCLFKREERKSIKNYQQIDKLIMSKCNGNDIVLFELLLEGAAIARA